MALHPDFPKSPYEILDPSIRWFPADEALRQQGYEKLLPPLVASLRKVVKDWRDKHYEGASETSRSLLKWWFLTDHPTAADDGTVYDFQYYFGQREAVETIIYLVEVANVKDKYDLLRFDSSGAVSAGMFTEAWKRYVIKMATGSGKTKVLSLILAWCYFHKTYEHNSALARNFLVIAPNIIVLDRLRTDFDGLKIFYSDPVLPPNGYLDRDWQADFQVTLHIQDEVTVRNPIGNIFLTNIHRVYEAEGKDPDYDDEDVTDYFLGRRPVGATNDSRIDLGDIIRNIDELVVLNDEAHHVHDEKMAWFKSIEDINNRLKMKGGELALQVDVTATPKHTNGAIFVQTVSDYPLVEAIYQDIVKHPVLPDNASRAKLTERNSSKYTEKYEDFIHLGYLEWKKVYDELIKEGKKSVLFVMTDDTKNCDEVANYLEGRYPELENAVLVIHTKNNGEISESATGKSKDQLDTLRKIATEIDHADNPYKAIVSVLMLKEGWDVRNVTTIVGLRAYSSKSNILPEQTLGRGLRRMFQDPDIAEYVSVVGTDAFMDFVDAIKNEGVDLERRSMGDNTKPNAPLIVEVDNQNLKKDIANLDIDIPILTPRIYREYKNLSDLDVSTFGHKRLEIKRFSDEEMREIVFKDISSGAITHTTHMDSISSANYQSVVGYFAQTIMRELRLVSGYDVLYEKVKAFVQDCLFETSVDLDDLNILRNLSELEASKAIIENFKKHINVLTVLDRGQAEIRDYIKMSKVRPFVARDQAYLVPKKSVFNKIIGDSHFELEFASFLEGLDEGEIVSYVKNYNAVHFRIDYQNADGEISNYYPDFIVKIAQDSVCIIETKGREDLDDPLKIARLAVWINDINEAQSNVRYSFLYVQQDKYEQFKPDTFQQLINMFAVETV